MNLDDKLRAAARAVAKDGDPDSILRDHQRLEARYQALRQSNEGLRRLGDSLRTLEAEEATYAMADALEQVDQSAAANLFRYLAQVDFADAELRLGCLLELLGDREGAEDWYLNAAAHGWAGARERLTSLRAGTSRGAVADQSVGRVESDEQGARTCLSSQSPSSASGGSPQTAVGADGRILADSTETALEERADAPHARLIVACPACGGRGWVKAPGSRARMGCRLCWERGRVSRIVADRFLQLRDRKQDESG
jgi:hypothetical protein